MDKVMVKLAAMSLGEKLIGGGAVAMVIISFLPWHHFSVDAGVFSVSVNTNAWEAPDALWSVLAVLIAVAMGVVVLGPKLVDMRLPDLGSVTWPQALFGAGIAVLVGVILKFLFTPENLGFGFFLAFIDAIALAVGGYLLYSAEKSGGTSPTQ